MRKSYKFFVGFVVLLLSTTFLVAGVSDGFI